MSWKGFKDGQATIIIDLKKTKEELWDKLEKDARRYVKKAENNNLVFCGSKDLDAFYPIYSKVAKYGGINPIPLDKLKQGEFNFLSVEYNGKIIGGVVINLKNGVPNMMINAIDSEFYSTYAGYFVYWNMILWAKEKGFENLDLGGYQLEAKGKLKDINNFKEKWGGEIKKYYVYSYNPFYIIGRRIIRKSSFVKKMWNLLKGR